MIISKIMSGVYELWKYGKSLYTSDHTNDNDYEYFDLKIINTFTIALTNDALTILRNVTDLVKLACGPLSGWVNKTFTCISKLL